MLAWNIAGAEAISAGFDAIEREHLFVSLTEIEKLLSLTAAKLDFSEERAKQAEAEYAEVLGIFDKLGLDPRKLRRKVRSGLGEGKTTTHEGSIRRSPECREIFQRAETLSGANAEVSSLDLLAALMNSPGRVISEAVSSYGVEPSRLLSAVNEVRLARKPVPAKEPAPKPAEAKPEPKDLPPLEPVRPKDERYMPPEMRAELAAEKPLVREPESPAPEPEFARSKDEKYMPPELRSAPAEDVADQLFGSRRVQAAVSAPDPQIMLRAAALEGGYVPPSGCEKLFSAGRSLTKCASEHTVTPAVQRERELKAIFDLLAARGKLPLLVGADGIGKGALAQTVALRIWNHTAPPQLKGWHIIELALKDLLDQSGDGRVDLFREALEEAAAHSNVCLYIKDIAAILKRADSLSILLRDYVLERGVRVLGAATAADYHAHIEQEFKFAARFERVEIKEPEQAAAMEILRANRNKLEIRAGGRITDGAVTAAYVLSTRFNLPGVLPKKALNLLRSAGELMRTDDTPALRERFAAAGKKFGLEPEGGVNELWVCQAAAGLIGSRLEAVAAELHGRSPVRLENLSRNIKGSVVGQNDAVEQVAARIAADSAFAGQKNAKPLLFYFTGPRGVGKTELARRIAATLFGGEEDVYIFDLAKYADEETLRRIFGSVKVEGRLEVAVKESPFGLVLFENADKTLPVFYNMLASFVEESASRGVELKNVVFVITSGLYAKAETADNFPTDRELVKAVMDNVPTVIQQHISAVVPFRPLGKQSANLIVLKWLDEVRVTMQQEYGVYIQMGRDVERAIVRSGLDIEGGARRLRQVFDKIVMQPLHRVIDQGVVARHKQWVFMLSDDHVVFTPKK